MKDLKYIGLLLFDGVEELDAVGPWEVISWWTRNHPEDGYRIITVADDLGAVTCAKGLRMLPLMTSGCTGALDPTITVRPHDRFVDDGDTITSSGVSAGIDGALHLVSRLAGPDRARETRRGIQYDPEPSV